MPEHEGLLVRGARALLKAGCGFLLRKGVFHFMGLQASSQFWPIASEWLRNTEALCTQHPSERHQVVRQHFPLTGAHCVRIFSMHHPHLSFQASSCALDGKHRGTWHSSSSRSSIAIMTQALHVLIAQVCLILPQAMQASGTPPLSVHMRKANSGYIT